MRKEDNGTMRRREREHMKRRQVTYHGRGHGEDSSGNGAELGEEVRHGHTRRGNLHLLLNEKEGEKEGQRMEVWLK